MRAKILVIGYGNPGRSDDGLGPALSQRLEEMAIPGVTVEADYQLSIEHAEMAARHDVVVFADADLACKELFHLRPVVAKHVVEFTSHSVCPEEILYIAQSCFGASPKGYILGMRPAVMEPFSEGLSPIAKQALEAALEYLLEFISSLLGAHVLPPT
jgi:hydrogenase maturation protease